jgi:hypothetical protein
MERTVEDWTIEELYEERGRITFPEYQREPRLWPTEKKARLIDSILRDIDIPKLYFYKVTTANSAESSAPEEQNYEVVDGQQRLWAIWDFLDGTYSCDGKKFADLTEGQPDTIRNYELQVTVMEDADDEYLREMFLRLQLGLHLNMGEKLNALSGAMKDLVFKDLQSHEFIQSLGIPERRFARQTLSAQVCINSFARAATGSFARTRYEDLQYFFKKYEHPTGGDKTLFEAQSKRISDVLNQLGQCFGENAKRLRNRSYVLSVYLFFEEVSDEENEISEEEKTRFAEFILTLWDSLKNEASKGIKRTDEGLYQFETYLSSAPGEKYQIERRHERLREYYEHFKNTGGVTGLLVSADNST